MRAVILQADEEPGFLAMIERRRALGQDGYDEVWVGVYHVAPMAHGRQGDLQFQLAELLGPSARAAGLRPSGPINIGTSDHDFRVPDAAFRRPGQPPEVWNHSAAIVVEIVSDHDESREKFDFYFARGVDEVVVIDPGPRSVEWFGRGPTSFVPVEGSALLGGSAADLAARLDWPH